MNNKIQVNKPLVHLQVHQSLFDTSPHDLRNFINYSNQSQLY